MYLLFIFCNGFRNIQNALKQYSNCCIVWEKSCHWTILETKVWYFWKEWEVPGVWNELLKCDILFTHQIHWLHTLQLCYYNDDLSLFPPCRIANSLCSRMVQGFNFQIVFLSLMVSDPQINSALLSAVSSPLLRRRGDSTWVRNPMTTVPGGQKTQSRHSPKDPY